jgi:hypothetical protein
MISILENYNILYGKRIIYNMITYNPKRIYKILFKSENYESYNMYNTIIKKNSIYCK